VGFDTSALERREFRLAWTSAAEQQSVQLSDALVRMRLARGPEPARFDRAAPRWHAKLCTERQLSAGEAQLALAALNALPGPGYESAAHVLAAVCERHGVDSAARVIRDWLDARPHAR
jgi:hypothetical protein